MGMDSSKKKRKPSPDGNASITTNIGAGSERYFLRRRPTNLARIENLTPIIKQKLEFNFQHKLEKRGSSVKIQK
jgi:hypothetical protein